jgi:IgGFc binding protein
MIQKLKYSILFILTLLSVGLVPTGLLAQEGIEFWICFQQNFREPKIQSNSTSIKLELFITSDYDAKVTIDIEGIEYNKIIEIPKGEIINIEIDPKAQVTSSGVTERKAVHISSDQPIAVYGLNRRHQSTDTFFAFPENVLGKEYRTMCMSLSDGLVSQFAVVATEDKTTVNITPNANTGKHDKGREFEVTLNKGEVYQVAAKAIPDKKCDLTGSLIKSDKKIAVFSGHQCAYVPDRVIACNHLVEQIPPVSSWGKQFYIGKQTRRSAYTYRVLAHEDSTRVFVDNMLKVTLDAGEHYESISENNLQINTSKPVLAAQYSQGFRNGDSVGDPMMILISPTSQYKDKYNFVTLVSVHWYHYINLVVPNEAITSITIDDVEIDPNRFVRIGNSPYSVAYEHVDFGAHVVKGEVPFGMISYGFGTDRDAYDAYGNMCGQSFLEEDLEEDTKPPSCEYEVINEQCKLIISDDRINDNGIKKFEVVEAQNFIVGFDKIDEGVAQTSFIIFPKLPEKPGRVVINAIDMNNNKSIITICYIKDDDDKPLVYQIEEEYVEECD